jgi:hypothetical protein
MLPEWVGCHLDNLLQFKLAKRNTLVCSNVHVNPAFKGVVKLTYLEIIDARPRIHVMNFMRYGLPAVF